MAPFIFWNLAFYTIIRTQLERGFPHLFEEAIIHNYMDSRKRRYLLF
ncbi:type I phosphodiesterase/nucleotide pyrophosphatase [Paenibacillus larvae subsp. larvae DSM 25430]|nr:type I phosphodiesterase/nucleotide pyrophosphatase [Paenibacillus larvae subsp. larvae DSM 25430]